MRLNNTRRQQDFGELVGLVDLSLIERVEVVRGPASVLYGSDAIGGVVNLVTRVPDAEEGLSGSVRYRYSTNDTQNKVEAGLSGRYGGLGVLASGTFREADAYEAPAGTFGEIRLDEEVRVNETGVEDESLYLHADYGSRESRRVFAKFERYRADDAGFGFVDPSSFAPELPLVQILYPFQTFANYPMGFSDSSLGTAFLDRLDATAYIQDNERRLDLNVEIPLATCLVMVITLALLAAAIGVAGLGDGIVLGLVVGLGIALPLLLTTAAFEFKKPQPWTWGVIDASYHVVGLTIAGAIIGLMA